MIPSISSALSLLPLFPQIANAATERHTPGFAFLPSHLKSSHSINAQKCSYSGPSSPLSPLFLSTSTTSSEIPSDTSVDDDFDPESVLQARNRLIALASTLASNSPSGKLISRPTDKIQLQRAVNSLESASSSKPLSDIDKEKLIGDWMLVATANLPASDIRRRLKSMKEGDGKKKTQRTRRSGLSLFGKEGKQLNPIQKSIRKSIEVTQRIRYDGVGATPTEGNEINRVDNVIEFTPLDTLEDIIPKESPLFNILGNVNINPLQVKKSKIVLVHKAEIESVSPVLKTKISLVSSVLNVAGTSQYFDPEGADVLGANVPLGEFLNVGNFDTPFVDDDIRVSRTRGPVLEQLRVFVRKGSKVLEDTDMMEALVAELRVEEENEMSDSTKNIEKVASAVQDVSDTVISMGEDVKNTIEQDLKGVDKVMGNAMNDVVERAQDVIEDDLQELGNAMEGVQTALKEDGDVAEAISNVTKVVRKMPEDVRQVVEEDAAEVVEAVEESLDAVAKDVQDLVEDDLKKIENTIKGVQETLKDDTTDMSDTDEAPEENDEENTETKDTAED